MDGSINTASLSLRVINIGCNNNSLEERSSISGLLCRSTYIIRKSNRKYEKGRLKSTTTTTTTTTKK